MNIIITEARTLWRYWSVKLAAVAGLIVAYLMSDPTLLPRIVDAVPVGWRPAVSVLVGFAAFALPTIARRLPQTPKDGGQ